MARSRAYIRILLSADGEVVSLRQRVLSLWFVHYSILSLAPLGKGAQGRRISLDGSSPVTTQFLLCHSLRDRLVYLVGVKKYFFQ